MCLGSAGLVTAKGIADGSGLVLLTLVVVFFAWLLTSGQWTRVERKRLFVIFGIVYCGSDSLVRVRAGGSTLNLFAERSTNNRVMGYDLPAPWYQSVNSMFLISLAPVFAWLWVRAGSGSLQVRLSLRSACFWSDWASLCCAGRDCGCFRRKSKSHVAGCDLSIAHDGRTVLKPGRAERNDKTRSGQRHRVDDGRVVSRVSVGNYMGGRMASLYESLPLPMLFSAVGLFAIVSGVVLAMFVKPMVRLMGGVR